MGISLTHHLDILDEGWTDRIGVTGYGVEAYIPRLGFFFNPDDYEAASSAYYPEVCADNPTASAIPVTVVRVDTNTVHGTVNVVAGASNGLLVRGPTSISWDPGTHEYAFMIGPGAANVEFFLYTGRIVCNHVNLTRGKFWSPLVNYTESDCDGVVNQIDLLAGGPGVLQFPAWSGIWALDNLEHIAASRSWGVESNVGKSGFFSSYKWGLYNVTRSAWVDASTFTSAIGLTALTALKQFASDSNWVNGEEYRWAWEDVFSTGAPKMYGARLYTYLTDIEKVTARYRVSKGGGANIQSTEFTSRVRFESSADLNAVRCHAAGFASSGAAGTVDVIDAGTADSGSAGSAVAAAQITLTDDQATYISPVWSPTDGNRYISATNPVPSGSSVHLDWHLVVHTYLAAAAAEECSYFPFEPSPGATTDLP